MKGLPALPALEPWPLAARLASAPSTALWTLVAAAPEHVGALAGELQEQLASLLDAPVDLVRVGSPQELLAVARQSHDHALVLIGLEELDAQAWSAVDVNRSRLWRDQPVIIVIDERRLPLVVKHAPNVWSWLGGSAWRGAIDASPGTKAETERV